MRALALLLDGRPFTIRTDHQALTALLTAKGVGRRLMRLMRWADRLLQYNFRVEHIPGRSTSVADMQSTHSAVGNGESSDDTGDTARLSTVFGNAQLAAITPKQLEEATSDDTLLCEASKFITSNWPAKCPTDQLKPLYNISNELSMCGSSVYRGERACIPKSLRTQVLQLAHEGHPGITRYFLTNQSSIRRGHGRKSRWT